MLTTCNPYSKHQTYLPMLSPLRLCPVHKLGPQMISLLMTGTLVLREINMPAALQLVMKDGFKPKQLYCRTHLLYLILYHLAPVNECLIVASDGILFFKVQKHPRETKFVYNDLEFSGRQKFYLFPKYTSVSC